MAKVLKEVPVNVTIKFPLIDETCKVDIQKGLAKIASGSLQDILMNDGDVDDMTLYRIVHAVVKVDEDLKGSFERYVAAYKQLDSQLQQTRGYGLEGDEEPEMKIPVDQLTQWLSENAPRVLQQAENDGFTPPAPKASATAPGL